jgi:hypothetical protein
MAYSQTDYFDSIIARQISSGRATSKTEVVHQALELLDRVTRGTGPAGATFSTPEEFEEMVLAGFDGPAQTMSESDWNQLRRRA